MKFPSPPVRLRDLIRREEGAGFIEKLIVIGLFIFLAAAGVNAMSGTAHDKLASQAESLRTLRGGDPTWNNESKAQRGGSPQVGSAALASNIIAETESGDRDNDKQDNAAREGDTENGSEIPWDTVLDVAEFVPVVGNVIGAVRTGVELYQAAQRGDWQAVGGKAVEFAATVALGKVGKVAAKGLNKGLDKLGIVGSSRSGKYASRVRARGVQDPKSHNFPYRFDNGILATKAIPKSNGYRIHQKAGSMNGKEGVFEIGVRKDGVIDHRFFRSYKK